MKFCCIFPGQGAQSLNMLDDLAQIAQVNKHIAHTFAVAKEITGTDYLAMTQDTDPNRINQTINTQPLMLISSYAIYLAWQEINNGATPDIVAGHSLGEFTALVAAGVLDFADALKLVIRRANYMQQAADLNIGAMAAVLGIKDETIIDVCNNISRQTKQIVAGVNFNAPGQVVIAGNRLSVGAAIQEFKAMGAKVVTLNVSVPAHTVLMRGAADKLVADFALVTWHPAKIKIIQNYNAKIHSDLDQIKEALIKQIYSAVNWHQSIEYIINSGINTFIESGPGAILTNMNKRINNNTCSYSLYKHSSWLEINQHLDLGDKIAK